MAALVLVLAVTYINCEQGVEAERPFQEADQTNSENDQSLAENYFIEVGFDQAESAVRPDQGIEIGK